MKLRQVLLMCVLVLAVAVVVVLPVAADKPVEAAFTFKMVDFNEVYETRQVGVVLMIYGVSTGTITEFVSSDPDWNLNGSVFYSEWVCPYSRYPYGTGPVPGKFRIVVPTAAGQPASGWEGNDNMRPWVDLDKRPNAGYWYLKGTGFGIYEHTSIEIKVYGWVDWPSRVYNGVIIER